MATPVPIDDPRSLDVPEAFETERLLIRCPLPGDGEAVNAAVAESLERLRPWMNWAREVLPAAETEALQCSNCLAYRQRSAFHFNVFLKQTGEFVSKPALFNIDWKVPSCEIGYWQRLRFQGQGLMTEAVLGVTEFAFAYLHMTRVELRCDSRNERSIRVAERAGYQWEGCLRNADRDPYGSLRDTLVYARISPG